MEFQTSVDTRDYRAIRREPTRLIAGSEILSDSRQEMYRKGTKRTSSKMTKKSQPKSLNDSLAALQRVNRLVGVQSFENNGKILKILSLVYAMSITAGYCVFIYHFYDIYMQTRVLRFERVTAAVNMYSNIIAVFILSLCGCLFTQVYKNIMARIDEVDKTLEKLLSFTNNRRTYVISVSTIVCYILFQLTTNISNESFGKITSYTYISLIHLHCQTLCFFVRFTFVILVMCMKSRFKRINNLLSEVMAVQQVTSEDKYSKIYTSRLMWVLPKLKRSFEKRNLEPQNSVKIQPTLRRSNHVVRTTKQLHLELCKASRLLCTHFGLQLLVIMALDIFVLINLLFILYNRLISPKISLEAKIKRVVLTVPLCVLYLGQLLFLNYICESTTREAARTAEIIHDLSGLIAYPSLRDEVSQFALQIIQRPLEFSPLGFLLLNNNLMQALVGSVSTYTVILIQVGDEWQEQIENNSTWNSQNMSLMEMYSNDSQMELTTLSEI